MTVDIHSLRPYCMHQDNIQLSRGVLTSIVNSTKNARTTHYAKGALK